MPSVPLDLTGSSLPAQVQDALIQLGYLQVVPVQESGVAGYCSIDDHFLLKAPSPVVVAAGNDGPSILAGENDGAVIGVVGHFPDACGSLDFGLVAVGIEDRPKIFFFPGNLRVLVERVGFVGYFLLQFLGGLAVADVVVLVAKTSFSVDAVLHQLVAVIIGKISYLWSSTAIPGVSSLNGTH